MFCKEVYNYLIFENLNSKILRETQTTTKKKPSNSNLKKVGIIWVFNYDNLISDNTNSENCNATNYVTKFDNSSFEDSNSDNYKRYNYYTKKWH